eukprot:jgi/Tetstr1/439953/TSEL_003019.t1
MDDMWKAKFSTYEKETLQDNWYEDRIQAPEEVSFKERERFLREQDPDLVEVASSEAARNMPVPRLTRHRLPGTKRCIPVHISTSKETPYVAAPQDFTTTNQAVQAAQSQYASTVRKPTLMATKNFSNAIFTDRTLRGQTTAKGYGATLPSHRPEEHATYFETTNQYFYDRKPMAAQELYQTDPLPEKGDDARYIGGYPASVNPNKPGAGPQYQSSKAFNMTKSLTAGFRDSANGPETQVRGKAGARHALEQDPVEGGAPYGQSVFLDVYQEQAKVHTGTVGMVPA